MPRWDPDAEARLVAAAIQLFGQRGYESVTINDIAEHAGLTRRSFFRYFPDKREVLFRGSAHNIAEIAVALKNIDQDVTAQDAVMSTLAQVGEFLLQDPVTQALRQDLIDDSPELQERERTKLAAMAASLADGLMQRGTPSEQAHSWGVVAAEIFRSAYLRCIRQPHSEDFGSELAKSRETVARFLA